MKTRSVMDISKNAKLNVIHAANEYNHMDMFIDPQR